MRTRTPWETAIICAAFVVAIAIVAPVDNGKWVVAVAVAGVAGLVIALVIVPRYQEAGPGRADRRRTVPPAGPRSTAA